MKNTIKEALLRNEGNVKETPGNGEESPIFGEEPYLRAIAKYKMCYGGRP